MRNLFLVGIICILGACVNIKTQTVSGFLSPPLDEIYSEFNREQREWLSAEGQRELVKKVKFALLRNKKDYNFSQFEFLEMKSCLIIPARIKISGVEICKKNKFKVVLINQRGWQSYLFFFLMENKEVSIVSLKDYKIQMPAKERAGIFYF